MSTALNPPAKPRLECLEDRLVPSGSKVTSTTANPNRAIAFVSSWFDANANGRRDSGETTGGSAVLISASAALTSAHMVYNASKGGYAKEVTIAPGRNGNSTPYGTFTAKNWVIPSAYRSSTTAPLDLAVLNFTSSPGTRAGTLEYKAYSDGDLRSMTLNNIGYPGSPIGSGTEQYRSDGPVSAVTSNGTVGTVQYRRSDFLVTHGSSGSPVYAYFPSTGARYVVGIHSRRNDADTIGYATRLTSAMLSFVTSARNTSATGGVSLTFNAGTVTTTGASGAADSTLVPPTPTKALPIVAPVAPFVAALPTGDHAIASVLVGAKEEDAPLIRVTPATPVDAPLSEFEWSDVLER